MVKPEEHDTDRAGRLIFSETFEKLNWIPNRVSEDYGIDYNVQAFDQRQPTGAWFQVQLKSSQCLSLVDSDRFVSFSIDLAHLIHYSKESKQPVFLILVNVPTRDVYWTCPLFDSSRILDAQEKGLESLTLRIPISQILPGTAEKFVETLNRAYFVLAAHEISRTTIASFDEVLRQSFLDKETLRGLQEKQDYTRLLKSSEAFQDGKYDEAEKRIQNILDDLDATLLAKFHALTQLNALDFRKSLFSGKEAIDITDETFAYALRLRKLASRQHKWVRLAAVIVHAAARVERAVHLDSADYMALKVHSQAATNPVVTLGLMARRAANAKEIIRLYNRALSTLKFLDASHESLYLGRLITRIATSISPYLVALDSSNRLEAANAFVKSALQVLDLSLGLVIKGGDQRGIGVVVLAALPLALREDSDAFRWAVQAKSRISDPQDFEEIGRLLEQTRLRWQGEEIEDDFSPDPIWQIFQKIARSVGVDISDEQSLLVRRLHIAATDDSPEPWLRFCRHLVLSPGTISPVDIFIRHNFGTETSPNKIAHCNLFDLHHEATDAEAAFQLLKVGHCDACSSRKPRSQDWKLTEQERHLWNSENRDFIISAERRGFGIRLSNRDDLDRQ